jgi:UDP-N-acetyl-D-mannosaminuronic acid dehydrogenase
MNHADRNRFDKISVIGLGYIGLPTAAVFATNGVKVSGVDVNERVVTSINAGTPHITEPDLDVLLRNVVQSGQLLASTTPSPANAFVIAVQTPLRSNNEPDVSYIKAAARAIGKVLEPGNLVVLESTAPVGTTERLSAWLADERPDLTFPHQKGEFSEVRIAHCPERVLPGQILREVVENARLIGGLTHKCAQTAMTLYRIFARGDCYLTNARTAELAKLAENAYRDVNIAFANELSVICDKLQINVWDLIRLANHHPRVNILKPGPGVGGHCIAIDPWFIAAASPKDSKLIRVAREVNNAKPQFVVDQVALRASKLRSPVIACLGLTYKADVDDLRESPAIEIVRRLAEIGVGELLLVEPHISVLPPTLAQLGLRLWDFDRAIERADILLVLVDHRAFADVDRAAVKNKIVIDTRGAWYRGEPLP